MANHASKLPTEQKKVVSLPRKPRPGTGGKLRLLNIQRTCVHDGPGIRTTLFFHGCGLRCAWCQNPESLVPEGRATTGEDYTVSDIVEIVSRDRDYYDRTGGGVTLSGGDPVLQTPGKLIPLLQGLKENEIHVAVETSLHVPWKNIEKLAPHVDLFLVDLKLVGDDEQHRACAGQDTRRIRTNVKKLLELGAPVKFRMVMVPGYNDADRNIRAAAAFLKSHSHDCVELLKFHSMYEDKATRLGVPFKALHISNDDALASVKRAIEIFAEQGVKAECLALDAPRGQAVFPDRVYAIQEAIRESGHNPLLRVEQA